MSWMKSQNNHALYALIISGNYAVLLMLFQNRKMNNYSETNEKNLEKFEDLDDLTDDEIDEIILWLDEL